MAFGEGLHTADPKHKKRLQMMALAGAGALVVVFMLVRRRQAAAAPAAATDPTQTGAPADPNAAFGTPSTFADNGASAAGLADAVTQGLSGVQSSLDNLQQAQANLTPTGSVDATAAPPTPTTTVNVNMPASNAAHHRGGRHGGAHQGAGQHTGQHTAGHPGGHKGGKKKTVVKGSHGTHHHFTAGTHRHNHSKHRR